MDTPRRPGLSVVSTRAPVAARVPRTGVRRSPTSTWVVRTRSHARPGSRPSSVVEEGLGSASPLVFGHRGSTGHGRRENSVESVLQAMSMGADGVEVDVRLTRDGVLVCSHDDHVTTALGHRLPVSRTTASELVTRVAGGPAEGLATLPQVLTALGASGGRHLVVEAKPVADEVAAFRTARALADLLVPLSATTRITVSSFDARVLTAVRRLVFGTDLRTGLLGHATDRAVAVLRQVDDAGFDEAHLSVRALHEGPHAVRMAHQRGISVTAWTVNGTHLARVAALGVDAVITDDIAAARATVHPTARRSLVVAETAC